MKKFFFALVLFFVGISGALRAQFVPQNVNDDEFQNFLKTKITYVQKTGRPDFDSVLEEAVSKYWKITPYELASAKEIEKVTSRKDVSILQPVNFNVTISNNNYSVTRSNMSLSLFVGGDKNYYPAEQVAFVCIEQKYDPRDYYKDLSLDSAYLREKFRIKDMIATMNRALQIVKDGDGGKVEGGRIKGSSSGWQWGTSTVAQTCKTCGSSIKVMADDVYNKDLPRLKTKTLYLLKDNFRDTRDIAKAYPFKFKIVDRKEFATAISQERQDIAYLMLTHSYWGGITIIDPSKHECIGAVHIDKCTTIDGRDLHEIVAALEKAEKKTGK
jgi:hypothetical protein